MSLDSTIKDLIQAIKESTAKKTSAYDTQAEVKRVDGNTAWVHIPGGVDETPVQLTIDAKQGDTVLVRVSGGRAWLMGNGTAPPTDNTVANEAKNIAQENTQTIKKVDEKATKMQKVAGNTDQYFWHTTKGTDTGTHITEKTKNEFLQNPELGGGNLLARSNGIAIREGLREQATFTQDGMRLYDSDGNERATFLNDEIYLGGTDGAFKVTDERIDVYGNSLANVMTIAQGATREGNYTQSILSSVVVIQSPITIKEATLHFLPLGNITVTGKVGENTITQTIDYTTDFDDVINDVRFVYNVATNTLRIDYTGELFQKPVSVIDVKSSKRRGLYEDDFIGSTDFPAVIRLKTVPIIGTNITLYAWILGPTVNFTAGKAETLDINVAFMDTATYYTFAYNGTDTITVTYKSGGDSPAWYHLPVYMTYAEKLSNFQMTYLRAYKLPVFSLGIDNLFENAYSNVALIGDGLKPSFDSKLIVGSYNEVDAITGTGVFCIGTGSSDYNRKTIFKVDGLGNLELAGTISPIPYMQQRTGTSYILGASGREALIYQQHSNEAQWTPLLVQETKDRGSWQMGCYNNENLVFVYCTWDNIALETNTVTKFINFTPTGIDVQSLQDLPASKVTSGTFDNARIPSLDASKITSGTLGGARLPLMLKTVSATSAKFTLNAGSGSWTTVTFSVPSGYELVGIVGFNSSHNQACSTGGCYKTGASTAGMSNTNRYSQAFTDMTVTVWGLCALSNIW